LSSNQPTSIYGQRSSRNINSASVLIDKSLTFS
jgi:hypothetical protein